jgi:GNAT superfamily N-acetyltransferase
MIYSKWQRSLLYGNDLFKLVKPPQAFYDAYGPYIYRILHQDSCWVSLAVLSDDHDVVLGFKVDRGTTLDYIYVGKEYRLHGIARSLLDGFAVDTFTHITKDWYKIWNNKYKDWKFNPFA